MAIKGTKIRVNGTKDQINEAVERLRNVFTLSSISTLYPSRKDDTYCCYLLCYTSEPNTLLNQLKAALADVSVLGEDNAELQNENQRLKQELGMVPKPQRGDMVLSPNHR